MEFDNMKIDLVYTWVDGNDPNWQKKKMIAENGGSFDEYAISKSRFYDNNELKYSLRSVELYMPWINHIYIVTDNQVPKWLDTTNPKISIVDHKEILPQDALPTFNSRAIEHCIVNIPNLSEHFLYANDDTMVRRPIEPNFFYTKDNKPIYRVYRKLKKEDDKIYHRSLRNCANIIKNKYGKYYDRLPHHNIDPYKKSDIQACYSEFKELIDHAIMQQFRTDDCIQRFLYNYFSCATGRGKYKILHKVDRDLPLFLYIKNYLLKHYEKDSLYIDLSNISNVENIIKGNNPKLICINDGPRAGNKHRIEMIKFYENLYPNKSSFEK